MTFNFVCFAWIFFRSDSLDLAWEMISGLFTRWGQPSPLVTAGVVFWIVVGIGSQYLPQACAARDHGAPRRAAACRSVGRPRGAIMLANAMGPQGVSPFIYFRF